MPVAHTFQLTPGSRVALSETGRNMESIHRAHKSTPLGPVTGFLSKQHTHVTMTSRLRDIACFHYIALARRPHDRKGHDVVQPVIKSLRRAKAVLDEARRLPRFLRGAFFVVMRVRWRGINYVLAFGRSAGSKMRGGQPLSAKGVGSWSPSGRKHIAFPTL